MQPSSYHFFPLAFPFILTFVFLIGLVIALIEIGILEYAYEKMGIHRRYVFTVLVLSLLGSYVNIPVAGAGRICLKLTRGMWSPRFHAFPLKWP